MLDTKQSESVEIIEGEAYVGGVEIGPRFGNVHVAIFGKRSREAERMIFLQRISGIQVKTHGEALGLVLYVVVTP